MVSLGSQQLGSTILQNTIKALIKYREYAMQWHIGHSLQDVLSTAIGLWKHRIPFDLRS